MTRVGVRNSRRTLLLAATALAGLLLLASCGGGGGSSNNFSDIQSTATARAAANPSPTVDPKQACKQQATDLSNQLSDRVNTLNQDLLGAQANQSDPKWPGILNSDIDLMNAKAGELVALAPPPGFDQSISGALQDAARGIQSGGTMLKQSIANLDPNTAATAVDSISTSSSNLDEAKTKLSAYAP